MKIYVLVGKSGTGKSYQAINLCKDKKIESIIDDGLFIYKNNVMAGKSAKRQDNTISAIKVALFHEDEHMMAVKKAIEEAKPESMLIIGTSDRMVEKIQKRLDLEEISERIYIEDLTTEEDRAIADKQRHILGKHVIPVPTLQLKRDFSGYFLDPMRIFKGFSGKGTAQYQEKTVVRPTFSYMGNFFINEKALVDIAHCVAAKTEGISSVIGTRQAVSPETFAMTIIVNVKWDYPIFKVIEEYQRQVTEIIEAMTAYYVVAINVEVKGLA